MPPSHINVAPHMSHQTRIYGQIKTWGRERRRPNAGSFEYTKCLCMRAYQTCSDMLTALTIE